MYIHMLKRNDCFVNQAEAAVVPFFIIVLSLLHLSEQVVDKLSGDASGGAAVAELPCGCKFPEFIPSDADAVSVRKFLHDVMVFFMSRRFEVDGQAKPLRKR